MAGTQWFWIAVILGVVGFAVNILARRERQKLRGTLAQKEAQIEKLNADALEMLETIKALEGSLNKVAPADGEVWMTRILRPKKTVEQQINDMVGDVREGDPRG